MPAAIEIFSKPEGPAYFLKTSSNLEEESLEHLSVQNELGRNLQIGHPGERDDCIQPKYQLPAPAPYRTPNDKGPGSFSRRRSSARAILFESSSTSTATHVGHGNYS